MELFLWSVAGALSGANEQLPMSPWKANTLVLRQRQTHGYRWLRTQRERRGNRTNAENRGAARQSWHRHLPCMERCLLAVVVPNYPCSGKTCNRGYAPPRKELRPRGKNNNEKTVCGGVLHDSLQLASKPDKPGKEMEILLTNENGNKKGKDMTGPGFGHQMMEKKNLKRKDECS